MQICVQTCLRVLCELSLKALVYVGEKTVLKETGFMIADHTGTEVRQTCAENLHTAPGRNAGGRTQFPQRSVAAGYAKAVR